LILDTPGTKFALVKRLVNVVTDEGLHGSGSSVSSVVSQTSSTVSSSVVSSRSGVVDQMDVGTFHSLSRLQEICKCSIDVHCIIYYLLLILPVQLAINMVWAFLQ